MSHELSVPARLLRTTAASFDPDFTGTFISAATRELQVFRVGGTPDAPMRATYVRTISELMPTHSHLAFAPSLLTQEQADHLFSMVDSEPLAPTLLVAAGFADGQGRPFVITYSHADGAAPSADMVARYTAFGPGTVVFRPGDVAPPAGPCGHA